MKIIQNFNYLKKLKKNFFQINFIHLLVLKNPCDELYKKYKNLKNLRIFVFKFYIKKLTCYQMEYAKTIEYQCFIIWNCDFIYMDHHVIEEVVRI